MSRGLPVIVFSIAAYYVLAFLAEAIHYKLDPIGVTNFDNITIIINAFYNICFFILIGFMAAFMYKGKQKNIATIVGLTIVVFNFMAFIIFPEEQPIALRMLKVVLPLHAAMIGGALFRKYKKTKPTA